MFWYDHGLCAPHHERHVYTCTHTPRSHPLQTKAALTREYNKGSHKSQALAWGQGVKVGGWVVLVDDTYIRVWLDGNDGCA